MKINYFKTFLASVAALLLSYCGPQEQQSVDDSGQLSAEEIRLNDKVPVSVTVSEKGQEGFNLSTAHEDFEFDVVRCKSGYEEGDLTQDQADEMEFYRGDIECEIELTNLHLEIDGSIVEFTGSWSDDSAAADATSSFNNSGSTIEVIVTVDSQLSSPLQNGDEVAFSYEVIRNDQSTAKLDGEIFDTTSVSVSGLNAPEYSLAISMTSGAGIGSDGGALIQLALSCEDGGEEDNSVCGDIDSSSSEAENLDYYWGVEEDVSDLELGTLDALSFSDFSDLSDPESVSEEVEGSSTLTTDLGNDQIYYLILKASDGDKASYQVFTIQLDDSVASNGG